MGAVSVCSGGNVVRDVCEEQIKSAIDCALSQVGQTTRPIEEREKKMGDSYFNLSQKMHLRGWK